MWAWAVRAACKSSRLYTCRLVSSVGKPISSRHRKYHIDHHHVRNTNPPVSHFSRGFAAGDESPEGPLAIDYQALLDERKFHKLADDTIQHIQEKVEDLVEEVDVEGFDLDQGEGVLTIKLGALGTYVINKQTPNRQMWLSSPVSGPARFDWDAKKRRWIYGRTKMEFYSLLEKEFKELLGPSVGLSQWSLR